MSLTDEFYDNFADHEFEPPPDKIEELESCSVCGKKRVKHITKEGVRYHVISWWGGESGSHRQCSEPNCEINHEECKKEVEKT